MCSSQVGTAGTPTPVSGTPVPGTPPGSVVAAALGHPSTLLARLHTLLDALGSSDLTGLSADEHTQLVTGLLRAQDRLHGVSLDAVAAFDTAGVAGLSRYRSTAQWIAHRTRLSPGAAAGLTRTARALRDHLPGTRTALVGGQIGAAHATAIASVVRTIGAAHASTAEPILLEVARRHHPGAVRAVTAELFATVDPAGAEQALHRAYERRGLHLSVVGEHGYLHGVFDVESTELLQTALQPLMTPATGDTRSTPQRRADALLDLAQHSLDTATAPELGGHRPHLSVVIDADTLRQAVGGAALPWTGTVLPATAARRWTCDATLTPVLARLLPPAPAPHTPTLPLPSGTPTGAAGLQIRGGWLPLAVGRTTRTATPAQLKALRVRDGGCVHPGCPRTAAYCHAHHITHWADGGPTNLTNLALLCRHHHRSLHAGHWNLTPDPHHPGLFQAPTPHGTQPAQTTADRSPPIRPAAT